MATYAPPTNIEELTIFNPAYFATTDIQLTQVDADKRYLKFPNAQGTENLQAINVIGVAGFNNNVEFGSPATSNLTPVVDFNKCLVNLGDGGSGKVEVECELNIGGFGEINMEGSQLLLQANAYINQGATNTTANSLGLTNFASTTPPTSSQTIPASNDNSTNIPTTAWVQTAIGGASILGTNNTFTGTNTFNNTFAIGDGTGTTLTTSVGAVDTNITLNSTDGTLFIQTENASGVLTDTLSINAGSNGIVVGNNVKLDMNSQIIDQIGSAVFVGDGTTQTSAYTGAGALSGSYTNSNITIDTDGKITAIANGSSGSPTTLVSTASTTGYNSGGNYTYWYFSTYPSWNAYSWVFNTPTTSKTNVNKTGLGSSPPLNVGTIGANGSFILMTGTGISQGYTATSSNMITYCAGFQQNYTIGAGANSAQLSLINCIGGTPASPFFQSNQLGENNGTCPPSATGLSGYIVFQMLNGDYTGLGTPTLTFTQLIA